MRVILGTAAMTFVLTDLSHAFYLRMPSCPLSHTQSAVCRRPHAPRQRVPKRETQLHVSTTPFNSKVSNNVLIVSPSGGIGEIAATTLAREGKHVKWFVVEHTSGSERKIAFPKETWDSIKATEGELDITGGDALSILLSESDPKSILPNVEQWCRLNAMASSNPTAIVVSLDGGDGDNTNEEDVADAVKRVTQLACSKLPASVKRIQVAPAPLTKDSGSNGDVEEDAGGWLSKPLNLLRVVPMSLKGALGVSSSSSVEADVTTFRHCSLFGVAESNLDSTPFVGGPRRDPILREEFLFRSVLMSRTRRLKKDAALRTSRLSLAQAVVQLIGSSHDIVRGLPKDITLASLRGPTPPSDEEWETNFQRLSVSDTFSAAEGIVVFEADFASVPSVPKLADWINLKWAPAVLGSYDIAGIRVGARPVYSTRIASLEEGAEEVDIFWQELINFEETVTVGKMKIKVTNEGIVASKKVLDAERLDASVSFPGEAILVRKLADAAGQAIDKKLAMKVKTKKVAAAPVLKNAFQASLSPVSVEYISSTGPRKSGARRSTQRPRGKRISGDKKAE